MADEVNKMINSPVIIRKSTANQAADEFSFTPRSLSDQSSLASLRDQAWQVYLNTRMPNDKDEAWRRTSLNGLVRSQYQLNTSSTSGTGIPLELATPLAGDEQDGKVFIQRGKTEQELKQEYIQQGVIFDTFSKAIEQKPNLIELLGSVVQADEGKFAALATAMTQDGIILYIPKGVTIKHPLHSIFWGEGDKSAVFSRIFVWLEEDANATYVHEYASSDQVNEDIFHSGLVEIYVGANAHLKFVELQSWGRGVWNISHERAVVKQNGQLEWIFGAVGSRLTKNFTDLDLVESGSQHQSIRFLFC